MITITPMNLEKGQDLCFARAWILSFSFFLALFDRLAYNDDGKEGG